MRPPRIHRAHPLSAPRALRASADLARKREKMRKQLHKLEQDAFDARLAAMRSALSQPREGSVDDGPGTSSPGQDRPAKKRRVAPNAESDASDIWAAIGTTLNQLRSSPAGT